MAPTSPLFWRCHLSGDEVETLARARADGSREGTVFTVTHKAGGGRHGSRDDTIVLLASANNYDFVAQKIRKIKLGLIMYLVSDSSETQLGRIDRKSVSDICERWRLVLTNV